MGVLSLGRVCAAVCLFLSFDLPLLLALAMGGGGLAKFAFIVKMFHFILCRKSQKLKFIAHVRGFSTFPPSYPSSRPQPYPLSKYFSIHMRLLPALSQCDGAVDWSIGLLVYWSIGLLVFWLWIMTKRVRGLQAAEGLIKATLSVSMRKRGRERERETGKRLAQQFCTVIM